MIYPHVIWIDGKRTCRDLPARGWQRALEHEYPGVTTFAYLTNERLRSLAAGLDTPEGFYWSELVTDRQEHR